MNDPNDVANFLAGLNNQPPPPPEPKRGKGGKNQTATSEKPKLPPPGEASGLDTQNLSVRTWQKKRILMNEPGIENAIAQIKELPQPEWSFHSIMGGDFHGFDMIPTIQRLAGKPLQDLRIATLGFNQRNNLQLCRMIDEGLVTGPVTIVASMYFAQSDPRVFAAAKAELEARGSTLANTRNHAKIIACQAGDDFYVIETSANLRSCNSLEQFTIANSEPLYRFHRQWIEAIANTTA